MDLSFMQNDLVLATCWTLIHSLWQGLILAIVVGIVMIGTRKSDAKKRYDLLILFFFLFAVVAVITFVRELGMVSGNTGKDFSSTVLNTHPSTVVTVSGADGGSIVLEKTWIDRFKEYFDQHASLIVAVWFVIFMARFVKLTAGLVYVQRLKSYQTFPVPELWENKIRELIRLLGIRKHIRLLESGIVKVPVVMGIFKPVILLPLGLLASLPADEIESILLHELAHIQRRDYFVNLLQSITETLFFFNPAVMWLSSMIREERENCCDDIAISITNNRTRFVNALIAFQEYNLSGTAYGVGFPGEKNHLLNRVKRIITERNKTLNATEKSLLSFGMAVLIMISFAAAKKAPLLPVKKDRIVDTEISDRTNKIESVSSDLLAEEKNEYPAITYSQRDIAEPVLQTDISGQGIADTVPVLPKSIDPEAASRSFHFSISDTAKYFNSFSTSINDNGQTRKMEFNAIAVDGKKYRLIKLNDAITGFYINDEEIPASQYDAHRPELDKIESTYRYKQERSREKQALALVKRKEYEDQQRVMRAMNMTNEKLKREAEQQQRTIENIKREAIRKLSEGRGKALNEKERAEFEKRVVEFKRNADSLKRTIARDQQERTLQNRQELASKMSELKAKKLLDRSGSGDSLSRLELSRQKLVFEKQISLLQQQKKLLQLQTPLETKTQMDLKSQKIRLKRAFDSLQRQSSLQLLKEQSLHKLEKLHSLKDEDAIRLQESTARIKNIINDLEKENIRIDLQKSWFALDNDQFIVDGKKISQELYDTFKVKYLRPNGWGYYYGPVQVTGRGIFLDYKNLAK